MYTITITITSQINIDYHQKKLIDFIDQMHEHRQTLSIIDHHNNNHNKTSFRHWSTEKKCQSDIVNDVEEMGE